MDLSNSMVWILPESMDLPDIFHSIESIQLLKKIKIHFTSDKDPYNFQTADFQYFSSVYNRFLKHFSC